MSTRDDSDRDDDGNGASPYDEPTGSFRVPPAATGRPADRDAFYDRHASSRDTRVRRVEELDDLGPDEVETRAFDQGNAGGRPAGTPSAAPTTPIAARRNPVPVVDDERGNATAAMQPPTPTPRQHTQALEVPEPAAYSATPEVAYSAVADDDEPVLFGDPDDHRHAAAAVIEERVDARRGTLDLGLLLLRVTVGLIAMAHGAQKLFGWWNGPRLSGFEDFLINSSDTAIGFNPDAAKPLAILGAVSELLGGLMLVLGLFTPIGAAAVLGVMIIATAFKSTLAGGVWFFASGQAGPGIEYEVLLAVCAAAIILCGPGRYSLDGTRGWARRPLWGSVAALLLGIAAGVAVWILFNGTNPLQPR